ncbi:hypothetical protein [Marinobacter halophilus]|uniref:Solute-binding protein family 3/N-terminal domain-containing protein n=1 Tax=Marinobacter halophilus TaxID=1323740 RepID=A0A2T1K9V9_9GAMM|nr:hypothetical protein [Marinobacter halophilus]PSF06941.1 hypothetical protein C7H08_17925 [Marinobacter halophilus]GGC76869.1 hypothetical protein GCM10011362_26870 [Marinobacter halophilus]
MACLITAPAIAGQRLTLKLGSMNDFEYLSDMLTQVLEADGYDVDIVKVADIPTTRLEWMLAQGELSAMMLGETPPRTKRFLQVDVAMTDNLMNQRILFIPPGHQDRYNQVETLGDFQALGLTAGMGRSWRDYQIWQANDLPVIGLAGEWRRLYDMVAIGNRGIDYLPRGAYEMAKEWPQYPNLQMEQNLVLVYNKDHILYVSPKEPALHSTLSRLLPKASDSGLIRALVEKHFQAVFEPPVNLTERRVIPLQPR